MKYIIASALFLIVYYKFKNDKWDRVIEDKNLNREEIISYAEVISKKYKSVKRGRRTAELIYYIKKSFKSILHDYTILDNLSRSKKQIVSPAEWLLDNLYMIEKEYRGILSAVSRSYFKNLPVLPNNKPRIYQIVEDYISHKDSDFDTGTFISFISKFQENTPLNIAELWALPVMIRMALIDKISRVSDKLIYIQNERLKGEEEGESCLIKLSEDSYEIDLDKIPEGNYSKFYIISFEKVLRDYGTEGTENYYKVLKKVSISYDDLNKIINEENKEEAVLKVNIGCLINSLRIAEGIDIKDIFSSLSVVEAVLNHDPAMLYQELDFESKEHYRSSIEYLSGKYKIPEKNIAEAAVLLSSKGDEDYKRHVGYYLDDDGKEQLLSSLNIKEKKINENKKVDIYIFLNVVFTLVLPFIVIYLLAVKDTNFQIIRYAAAYLLSIIPFSEIVNSIINWSINNVTKPSFVPKTEIKGDIPEEYRTIVAIPAIIKNKKRGKELIDSLEIYYLANECRNLYFVLLADYKDSRSQQEEEDWEIADECIEYINELNKKYKKDTDIFYYLSRSRQYNPKEDKWLGWERKRGKLVEFNHLLRGDKSTSYNVLSSDISELTKAKYVITLDADTFLPKEAVKKLVGAMINPLNRPVIDYKNKKVLRGYSLMQPRITVSTRAANMTPYSKIFSGETGFDIYTTAISDVYMDAFKEGIYTGKGIYDIDAFNFITDGEINENTVLSHDLLEGSLVRTALITDVNLVDGYPSSYNSGSKRLHRWVRGDWQLIKYLKSNKLNRLSKWKIVDNLRRSLLCPSIVILLLISIMFFQHKEIYLAIAFVSFLFPIIFDVSETVVTPIKGIGLSGDVSKFKYVAEQFFLIFSFIPFQGYLMMDAIIRTLYRVFISKKNLLEWQTADDMEKTAGKDMMDFISFMWPGTVYSIIILIVSYYESGRIGIIMLLPCLLWIISPYTAYFISMENKENTILLNITQLNDLRKLTRKSFAYFQDFVNEKTKYIAPDNFQEEPNRNIALRTSPTNIGMTIISNITAYDMGYIGVLDLIERLNKTISTMKNLTMYNGHFYNWYDLNDLKPLCPCYISTVDSGNLAGYLMTSSKALSDIKNGSFFNKNILIGINDTISLANDEIKIDIFPEYCCETDINKFYDFLNKISSILVEKDVESYWSEKLKSDVGKYINEINFIKINGNKSQEIIKSIDNIISYFDKLVEEMDFTIMYNPNKELFSIGYNVDRMTMDNCYYDLLASEARQASFIAIAKGEIEVKHWFKLGRATAIMGKGKKGLVSWSGTMFEYFMPQLIMKNYKDSLLDLTYNSVISGQKEYCSRKKVPWGISESAFYDFDINMIYQYKAFGVPGIGLKRGLSNELVISPYSSILALMTDKRGAYNNLKKLKELGVNGRYGFYEAIDYTHNIGRKNGKGRVVKCFMVHHLGMSLLSLDNVINENIMQNRFHSIPRIKSAELLLQEKAPKEIVYRRKFSFKKEYGSGYKNSSIVRNYGTANTKDPETLLLSNGSCHMMITNSGSGWCKNDNIFFYRWRRDKVKDDLGYFFYIRNIEESEFFSSCYQPVKKEGDRYNVSFSLSSAEFSRLDGNLKTTTKITLSAEDDVELRKITISNLSEEEIVIEITSYMEIALSSYNSDLSHPAFSNLFISTEYDAETESLIGRRRKREPKGREEFLLQSIVLSGEAFGDITYETSREKFIGRGRNLKNPQALDKDKNLSNTLGAVIDPIFSIRKRIRIKKNKSASIAFITAYSVNLNKGLTLIKKYKDMGMVDRTFVLSKIEKEIELKYNSMKAAEANLYQLMASKIIFLSSKAEELDNYIRNVKTYQTDFWKYGISGDLPIVTLILRDQKGIYLLKQVLKAFYYLNTKGLDFDLVIEVKDKSSYEHPIWRLASDEAARARCQIKIKDKIFVLKEDTITEEFRNLLYGSSRLLLDSGNGSLMNGIRTKSNKINKINPEIKKAKSNNFYEFKKEGLEFFNGYGGFNKKDGTYTILLNNYSSTPKPWVNIISNKNFGTMISELGVSYSFNKNSRENKISSWSNDPVIDGEGELIYFRDEDGKLSSITGKPIRDQGEYIVQHGFGYSVFKHYFMDLIGEMTVFVPIEGNLKINLIKIKNNRDEDRKISMSCYIDLVMGVNKENTAQYITTYINKDRDYIYANNPYNYPFNKEIAYLKILAGENSYTGKREEFIGRNESLDNPEGLKNISLSNSVGAGFDPCLSALSSFDLKKGEEKWIIIILGEEDSLEKIDKETEKYKDADAVLKELEKTKLYWKGITGSLKAETEDEDFNLLINGPLLYQTLSCRIWGRTGFYQCGGAYGFRDQLQDVMALHYIKPDLEREHILLSASRQYEEGDVQHWWHPYVESGIRTRFSDDLLWLPYAVLDYINAAGDYSILKEHVNYLYDTPLREGEDERYNISRASDIKEPLLSHIIKAIDRSLKFGIHGLPLMGSGDWNDGMNTVGNKGKGESVWLGFFLCRILKDIIPVLKNEDMNEKADYYLNNLNFIKENIEKNAYDGSWYRRAYFDDGTPVGSISSGECKIDSLSQSWSVISGAADIDRARTSMDSLEKNLYLKEKGLILLLTPPFNKWEKEPGYIKGYVPGVRENGGQYTHGAIWAVLAEIMLNRGNTAYEMYSDLNPINHSKTKLESDIYMVEPYIMTADIYASEPHIGRGGWSFYTGAAGWMYRVGIEGILGFKIQGRMMKIQPCIPDKWKGYKLEYITDKYDYKINVIRDKDKGIYLDGIRVEEIMLEEGRSHNIVIKI